jgi:hypothetical protein
MALTQIVKDGLGASLTATSEGGAVTTSVQQGLTKGWGHFEGSDGTLDDSFNMASLTDNGTGIFSPQFSSAMSNVHYTCNANMNSSVVSSNQTEVSIGTYATGSVKLTFRDGGSTVDKDDSVFIIHGDLA